MKFLLTKSPKWFFLSIINNLMKIAGYKLGQKYDYLPLPVIKEFQCINGIGTTSLNDLEMGYVSRSC